MFLSLYDYTGIMAQPWVEAGHEAFIFDIQHTTNEVNGAKAFNWDILKREDEIIEMAFEAGCTFMAAFPPCTDLAVSGAKHFYAKAVKNPLFQEEAMELFYVADRIGEKLGIPYFMENPVSVASTLWRQPDFWFHPWEFGGYLPEDDVHPLYPQYILPRDAYPKKTGLWAGGGFTLPPKKPVFVLPGWSRQMSQLGGKSLRTKNIRSATPRGFARAIWEMYGKPNN